MLALAFENKFIEVTDVDSVISLKERKIVNRFRMTSVEFENELTGERVELELSGTPIENVKPRHPSVHSEEFHYSVMGGNGYKGKVSGILSYLSNSITVTESNMIEVKTNTVLTLKGFYISGYELS